MGPDKEYDIIFARGTAHSFSASNLEAAKNYIFRKFSQEQLLGSEIYEVKSILKVTLHSYDAIDSFYKNADRML